jgi:hydroxypyruvate reductase
VNAAIGGGEYTVRVKGSGIGGRNTEFALAAAIEMDRVDLCDWMVASLATDGDDAMTEVAGGIVDGASVRRMRERGQDPEGALADNDSLTALDAIGATHVTGPTGTNVNDLYLAVRLMNM